MADWPLFDGLGAVHVGVNGTLNPVTALPNAVGNTYGAWAQLTASTPFPVSGFWVFYRQTTAFYNVAFNIGMGAAGAEQVLVQNLPASGAGTRMMAWIPLAIPQGVRLAVQMVCNQTAGGGAPSLEASLHLCGNGLAPGQLFGATDQYGFAIGVAPVGILVDPGSNTNTKGNYFQITSGTTRPASALMIEVWPPNTPSQSFHQIDIAVGSSGNEQIVVADAFISNMVTNNQSDYTLIGPFPCNIPAGTRLSARADSNRNTANSRECLLSLRTFS